MSAPDFNDQVRAGEAKSIYDGADFGDVPPDSSPPESEQQPKEAAPGRGPRFHSLAERALVIGYAGDPIPMGFDALDQACRGGLRPRRLVVVTGAPGALKTMLAMQWAVGWARAGHHVAIVAADEPQEGIHIRIGQTLGLCREDLERGDERARVALSERCADQLPNLILVDPEEDSATLADVGDELTRRANGALRIVILDGLQAYAAGLESREESIRLRIDAVCRELKRLRRLGFLVVCTSEVARLFYQGAANTKGGPPNRLASAKDSGGPDYVADLILAMASVPDTAGDSDIYVPKNRLGTKPGGGTMPAIRLRADFARATLRDVVLPTPTANPQTATAVQARHLVWELAAALPEALKSSPGSITSFAQLVSLVATDTRAIGRDAVNLALSKGWIVRPQKQRQPFTVGTEPPVGPPSDASRPQSAAVGQESAGQPG